MVPRKTPQGCGFTPAEHKEAAACGERQEESMLEVCRRRRFTLLSENVGGEKWDVHGEVQRVLTEAVDRANVNNTLTSMYVAMPFWTRSHAREIKNNNEPITPLSYKKLSQLRQVTHIDVILLRRDSSTGGGKSLEDDWMIGWTSCLSHPSGPIRFVTESSRIPIGASGDMRCSSALGG